MSKVASKMGNVVITVGRVSPRQWIAASNAAAVRRACVGPGKPALKLDTEQERRYEPGKKQGLVAGNGA